MARQRFLEQVEEFVGFDPKYTLLPPNPRKEVAEGHAEATDAGTGEGGGHSITPCS